MVTRADVVTKENIDQFWTAPASMAQPEPAKAVVPAFDSMCQPADEATVKPVDKKPAKPMKIAVLGLENNPFWIPVKEGTQKAAEELKANNVTVDWIVPGDQHTAEVFGQAIDAAIAQKYDALATIAGDAGVAPFIDKAIANAAQRRIAERVHKSGRAHPTKHPPLILAHLLSCASCGRPGAAAPWIAGTDCLPSRVSCRCQWEVVEGIGRVPFRRSPCSAATVMQRATSTVRKAFSRSVMRTV